MKIEEIKELIDLCSEKSIAELEVELKTGKVRILTQHKPAKVEYLASAGTTPAAGAVPVPGIAPPALPAPPPAEQQQAAPAAEVPKAGAKAESSEPTSGRVIVSPMVGTFYSAPSPDAPPFVDVGQEVKPDTVVCIVEAMKLMNEIKAEVGGRIKKVLIENGQPVEYNQPLFELE